MKIGILSGLGIVTGIVGEALIVHVTQEPSKVFSEKCVNGDTADLARFEPWLAGGSTISCFLSQFFYYALADESSFAIVNIIAMYGVMSLILGLEASNTKSMFVQYPFLTLVIGQYIGIGVAVPLLWIPFFCFGTSPSETRICPFVDRGRIICASLVGIILLVVGKIAGIAAQDTQTQTWALIVGSNEKFISLAFKGLALLSFLLWAKSLYDVTEDLAQQPLSLSAIWDAIFTYPNFASRMLLIDLVCLFLGALLYLGSFPSTSALEMTLLFLPIVGPGCAVSLSMANLYDKFAMKAKKEK